MPPALEGRPRRVGSTEGRPKRTRALPDHGLRAKFHRALPRIHWQALESGVIGVGTPDSNGCADGVEFWIEHKWTDTFAVGLEAEQVGWILRRMRAGGRVFVATWRQPATATGLLMDGEALWLHEGWDAATLKAEGLLAAPPVLRMDGGPESWDWGRVSDMLTCWVVGRR